MRSVRSAPALVAAGVGACLIAACDLPTEPPILEQRWIIEVEGTTMPITELLPADVDTAGGNFTMNVDAVSANETLGNLCASCFDSAVPVPVPAFNGFINATQNLPTDVDGATVASGSMEVTVQNNFDFDPLADGGSGPGTITVTLTDGPGGDTIGSVSWTGPGETMPEGSSRTKTLVVAPGLIGADLRVVTEVDVPGGQSSTMNTADVMTVTATPSTFSLSTVLVLIANKPINFGPEPMETEDIPEDLINNIVSGSIVLDITNPFGLTLAGSLNLGSTSKTLNVGGAASSKVTLGYSATDLQSILGQPGINFEGSAVANATGPVEIAPTQALVLSPSIDLTIQIGG